MVFGVLWNLTITTRYCSSCILWTKHINIACLVYLNCYQISFISRRLPFFFSIFFFIRKAVYWSTFLLAWVFLPVLYEAWYAGEYTWKGRIISALKVNLKSYILTAILGIIFGIYLMVSENLSVWAISDFFMVFGNTYGFLLVIVLLGNGLVEVPRFLWRYGDTEREIKYMQLQAVSVDTELFDSQCELDDALRDVKALDSRVKASSSPSSPRASSPRTLSNSSNRNKADSDCGGDCGGDDDDGDDDMNHRLRLHMDFILDVCDFGMKTSNNNVEDTNRVMNRIRQQRHGNDKNNGSHSPRDEGGGGVPTSQMLSNALKRIRISQEKLHASKQKWSNLLIQYEKFSKLSSSTSSSSSSSSNMNSGEDDDDLEDGKVIVNAVKPTSTLKSTSTLSLYMGRLINKCRDLWYRNGLTKICLNILASLCMCMSGIILWSELLIGFKISMSPWGLLISQIIQINNGSNGSVQYPMTIQVLALLPYAYMSLCTFYSLFKLKLFGLLTLCGPQQSTPGPLLFNAIYLIRLQFPLGLNYLLMLSPPYAKGSAAIGDDVAFRQLFSSIDTIPLFGQGFVVYAPIVLSILCVFTILNVYSRILQFIGIDSDDVIDNEDSAIVIKEGIMLLEQASRRNRKKNGGGGGGGGNHLSSLSASSSLASGLGNRQVVLSPFHDDEE